MLYFIAEGGEIIPRDDRVSANACIKQEYVLELFVVAEEGFFDFSHFFLVILEDSVHL
jgi:hypothetical protein